MQTTESNSNKAVDTQNPAGAYCFVVYSPVGGADVAPVSRYRNGLPLARCQIAELTELNC